MTRHASRFRRIAPLHIITAARAKPTPTVAAFRGTHLRRPRNQTITQAPTNRVIHTANERRERQRRALPLFKRTTVVEVAREVPGSDDRSKYTKVNVARATGEGRSWRGESEGISLARIASSCLGAAGDGGTPDVILRPQSLLFPESAASGVHARLERTLGEWLWWGKRPALSARVTQSVATKSRNLHPPGRRGAPAEIASDFASVAQACDTKTRNLHEVAITGQSETACRDYIRRHLGAIKAVP